MFSLFRIFEQLALAFKNRVFPQNFSLCWIYFLPFKIFEQLCAYPEKQSLPWNFSLYSIYCIFYIQDFWATCACPEFVALNIYFLQWRAVRFLTGEALSLSKPNLRVYELNGVAWIHHSTGCLQNDYCLCFLSHIIICYTHIGTMAILDLKKSNI